MPYIYFTFTMTVIIGEESALFWWNLFVFCSSSRLNTTISRSAQIFWILERFLNCELLSIWWKLFVDLWIKPGFEIVFSIWQPFQKRFALGRSVSSSSSSPSSSFFFSLCECGTATQTLDFNCYWKYRVYNPPPLSYACGFWVDLWTISCFTFPFVYTICNY